VTLQIRLKTRNSFVWVKKKKALGISFKPASARADEQVQQNRVETGNQLASDMQLSAEERAERARRGFINKLK
jgi:hypothetical protein